MLACVAAAVPLVVVCPRLSRSLAARVIAALTTPTSAPRLHLWTPRPRCTESGARNWAYLLLSYGRKDGAGSSLPSALSVTSFSVPAELPGTVRATDAAARND